MDMAVDVASPLELIRHVASGNFDFTVVDNVGGANSVSKNSVNFLLPSVLDLFLRSFSYSDHNRPIATLVDVGLQFSDCVTIHSAVLDVPCDILELITSEFRIIWVEQDI